MEAADLAAWTGVAVGVIAVVGSLIGVILQVHKQWLLSSAALVSELLAEFNSAEFAIKRRRCAELMSAHLRAEDVTLIGNTGFGVFGMFEHIAYLVRRKALDKDMVWNKFGWEIVGYYFCVTSSTNLLEQLRSNHHDETLYEHFEWFAQRMISSYQSRKTPVYDKRGRLTWLEPFIQQELTLGVEPVTSDLAARGPT